MITRVSDSFLFTLMVSALFCAESDALENAVAQKMLKIFSSLCYTKFTTAKVWQENEEYFSEKPTNWSVLPEQSYGYGRFESFVCTGFSSSGTQESKFMNKEELAYIQQDDVEPAVEVKPEVVEKAIPFLKCLKYRQTWSFFFGEFLTDGVWWLSS